MTKLVSLIVETLSALKDEEINTVEVGNSLERYVELEDAEWEVDTLITILRHAKGEYEQ